MQKFDNFLILISTIVILLFCDIRFLFNGLKYVWMDNWKMSGI